MRSNCFIASTLANDPHTEGLHNASKIARYAQIKCVLLKPSPSIDELCEQIKQNNPRYIGLSYRLTPEIGCRELEKTINYFYNEGLIRKEDDVKICFAGLPLTINMLRDKINSFPLSVALCEPYPDVIDRAKETIEFFDIKDDRENILNLIKEEVCPQGISLLDQLADDVIAHDTYKEELPLRIPSQQAIHSYTRRIEESEIPILRSHFGIPADDIKPTVEGIKELAEARVVDEISLGSSDLSQRYFGHPEFFIGKKNDGGVPYKTAEDLVKLYQASRRGNYPSVKPYCHVVDIVPFMHTCLQTGLLDGAHQAVPLFWFNELDGRGPMTVRDSIKEHFAGVCELAKLGIPVEMNDPNQWSSRWAHDTIITTSYALIAAVMSSCGVKNMVFQMQMNKPKETGDFADLAKMKAGFWLASQIAPTSARLYKETRTGIESLSPDMNRAKWQLGRSTLLQMCMNPQIIHIVSYCEANYAARPADIIDSSKLIRRAVRIFKENEDDIRKELESPIIKERQEYLINETIYLLTEIAKLHSGYTKCASLKELVPYIANPSVLASAIEKHIISAPGIVNAKYKGDFVTRPMKYGMINLVSNYDNPVLLTEKERLNKLI